jgi:hypothetical protein
MSVSPRTKTLIDLVPKGHRLTQPMIDAIISVSAANESFAGRKIVLASDTGKTPRGRQDALRDDLTDKYGKQLVRARAPVVKARAEITSRHAAMKVKPVDPADSVTELRRMEMRTYLCSLSLIERKSLALTTKSQLVLESILTADIPELAGFGQLAQDLPEIRQRYFEVTDPNEIKALSEMDAVVVPAEQACHIARNEMRSTIDIHPHDFDELMRPIEVSGPWLTSDRRQVIEIGADGFAKYRPASADDVSNGRIYNEAEFRASLTA